MPAKWKIFRIINYLIILPAVIIILALLITSGLQFHSNSALLTFLLITACGIILITNCVINHFWLESYYPEKYPGTAFRNFSAVFFVLMILVLFLLTGIFIAAVYDLFLEDNVGADINWGEYAAFGLIGFIILSGIYLLVYRIKLRRLIRGNQQRQFNNFLEINS
jgi:drug/metabolite transporter (DMT)-like permease